MYELHLIRHAKSSWGDAGLRDFDRPLNPRGQRDAPRMAEILADTITSPVYLVSSPALRAWETAAAFAKAFDLTESAILAQADIYAAGTGTLLGLVNALSDVNTRVLMFGHNPGISALARLLAPCPFVEMPTCGITSLSFESSHWRDVIPGSGKLLAYRHPKQD